MKMSLPCTVTVTVMPACVTSLAPSVLRKYWYVTDEVGHDVAVHQGWGCRVIAGDVCGGEGRILGDEDGDAGSGVEFGS